MQHRMLPLPSTQRICHQSTPQYLAILPTSFPVLAFAGSLDFVADAFRRAPDGRPTRYIQGLKNDVRTVNYLDLAGGISRSAEAEFSLVVRPGELEVSEAGGVSHLAIGSDERIYQHLSKLEPPGGLAPKLEPIACLRYE